jgi:peptidylprolyl isomerase
MLAAGSGKAHPTDEHVVRVHYTVWKADGTLVQHVPAGQSLVIALPKMIPGWGAATKKMVVGERRRAWVSPELSGGKSDIGLVFDTELLEIIEQPKAPENVAAPPADATTTESGLAYKVLKAGEGERRPSRSDRVVVHYSGWTTDGRRFDSSVLRGTPAEFPVTGVIRGWIEGLQLMRVGEKTRFWIPAKLAYGENPGGGKPAGMLVFDVELLAIK